MRFDLFQLSNLRSQDTGIAGAVIWVSAGEPDGVECHLGPRLWIVVGEDLSPVNLKNAVFVTLTTLPKLTGTLPPKIADQVMRFIEKNRSVLLAYWHAEISTREMLDRLESP